MKYLLTIFGVTLAFIFATAIAERPVTIASSDSVSDWNDMGRQNAKRPVAVQLAE